VARGQGNWGLKIRRKQIRWQARWNMLHVFPACWTETCMCWWSWFEASDVNDDVATFTASNPAIYQLSW